MIIAGIVTFEPDIDRLRENIEAISPQVPLVLIYDNGSTNGEAISELSAASPNVSVIRSGTNDGIAAALNRLAESALSQSASFLLTLDQDSVCSERMVSKLAAELAEGIGMVTPHIVDRNKQTLEEYSRLKLPSVEHYRQPARRGAITSGAVLDLNAWRKVGGFDELFFIDYVDYDFNQRLMEAGYAILRVNTAPLLHEVGRATRTWLRVPRKDLSGRWRIEQFFAFGHSPTRCYYKARNRVLFTRKHGRKLGITHEGIWQIPQQIALTVLFEHERFSKLKGFVRGIRDGLRTPLI
ncbi:rhamnosyltransferase [Pseudarthrobacter sp. W1I19]|uniref:glycosyltransferase n=1 Tax=Pseudarthrobacter sp. W1I19 TaxID=3042288 RepID=UPI0027868F2F|nr:glycosyltransferase [Pseudarthrobacter sp. W1I19]MDQ0922305.1 rhamnosyltransferase [Pseudarthrobacter sp. W1I19]